MPKVPSQTNAKEVEEIFVIVQEIDETGHNATEEGKWLTGSIHKVWLINSHRNGRFDGNLR